MAEVKQFAFVLMPFAPEYRDVYELGIKKTAVEAGVVAERVDEQHYTEPMLERIYRQIEQADFIIAEMTGKNANVFYEVGYAHAKDKKCLLLLKEGHDIPFDLRHHQHVIYDGSASDLAEKLRPKIEWLKQETADQLSKSMSVSLRYADGFLEKTPYSHNGSFDLEIRLKNETNRRSPTIEAIYVQTTDGWEISQAGKICPTEQSAEKPGLIKHLLVPTPSRLSAGAFGSVDTKWERKLWSKFDVDTGQPEDVYHLRGVIQLEVVTAEGTFVEEQPMDITFDEIPF